MLLFSVGEGCSNQYLLLEKKELSWSLKFKVHFVKHSRKDVDSQQKNNRE